MDSSKQLIIVNRKDKTVLPIFIVDSVKNKQKILEDMEIMSVQLGFKGSSSLLVDDGEILVI